MKYILRRDKIYSLVSNYLDKHYSDLNKKKVRDIITFSTIEGKVVFVISQTNNFSISLPTINEIKNQFGLNTNDAITIISDWAKVKFDLKKMDVVYN